MVLVPVPHSHSKRHQGCRSGSRSWMCQCCGSWKKSWRLLLVRSSATQVQATGDSTGGRAQSEQIVDVPVPQIREQIVEVIKVILQEQCQRMRFFSFLRACGEGAVGSTERACCPTVSPTRECWRIFLLRACGEGSTFRTCPTVSPTREGGF